MQILLSNAVVNPARQVPLNENSSLTKWDAHSTLSDEEHGDQGNKCGKWVSVARYVFPLFINYNYYLFLLEGASTFIPKSVMAHHSSLFLIHAFSKAFVTTNC